MQISSIRLTDTRLITGQTQRGDDEVPSQRRESVAAQTRGQTFSLSKWATASLAPIPEKTPEAHLHVVVEQPEDATRMAVPKVGAPSTQQRINRRHGCDE